MTIAEKSTELGIDLAQIALDANPIYTCTNSDVFKCYCAGGEAKNIYIVDENGEQISPSYYRYMNNEFTEETPLATIQADFLAYINGQEFVEMPVADVLTPKE
jgi:hypothetical protein